MKYQKIVFILNLFFALLILTPVPISAKEPIFQIETADEHTKQSILSNLGIIVLSQEPSQNPIVCFDVNENGLLVLGSRIATQNTIAVYTHDGIFQYGYQFESNGDFAIEWANDCVAIYLARSNVKLVIDQAGNCKEMYTILDPAWFSKICVSQRAIGNCLYEMRNNMGIFNFLASSYSQLVMTDADGLTIILYDAHDSHIIKIIFVFAFVLLLVGIALGTIISPIIKANKNNNTPYPKELFKDVKKPGTKHF